MRARWRRVVVAAALLTSLIVLGWLLLRRPHESISDASAPAALRQHDATGPAIRPLAPPPVLQMLAGSAASPDTAARFGLLEGRVVKAGTERGVSGAIVSFTHGGAMFAAQTDRTGQFRFEPVAEGPHALVSVVAEGYLPFAPPWGQTPIVFHARPGQRLSGVTIQLVPAIDYTGVVTDPDRRPIQGVQVELSSGAEGAQEISAIENRFVSGANGEFVFQAAEGMVLEARHPGFAPGRAVVTSLAMAARRVTIVLARKTDDTSGTPTRDASSAATQPAAAASGRLLVKVREADDTTPIPAFAVTLAGPGGDLGPSPVRSRVVFDARGELEWENLAEGSYRVHVGAYGFAPGTDTAQVSAQGASVSFSLRRGGTLTGLVIDESTRQPIASAQIALESSLPQGSSTLPLVASATSDESGKFELPGLTPGLRSIAVTAPAHHQKIMSGLELREGETTGPITVTLTPLAPREAPHTELVGIGAAVRGGSAGASILSVIAGGGAQAAGLTPGDLILEIDGRSVSGVEFGQIIQALRGPEGTVVRLKVRQAATGRTLELTVERRKIQFTPSP